MKYNRLMCDHLAWEGSLVLDLQLLCAPVVLYKWLEFGSSLYFVCYIFHLISEWSTRYGWALATGQKRNTWGSLKWKSFQYVLRIGGGYRKALGEMSFLCPRFKKKWIWFNQCVVNYVVFDLVVRIYSFFYRIFDWDKTHTTLKIHVG